MSHQVRLDDQVYELVKSKKRNDESFSDAIARLVGGQSLRDLRDVFDDDDVDEMRDAIDAADEADRADVHDVAERIE